MTPAQWRLATWIERQVLARGAVTERQLAEDLQASAADVHKVVGMLTGRKRIDRAGDFLVPAPSAQEVPR